MEHVLQEQIPGQAGNDVGEIEFFSYSFKFFRINQQVCPSFQRRTCEWLGNFLALIKRGAVMLNMDMKTSLLQYAAFINSPPCATNNLINIFTLQHVNSNCIGQNKYKLLKK